MHRREFLVASGLWLLGCRGRARPSVADPPPQDDATRERVIDEGRSDYNHVIVTERGSVRKMYFSTPDDVWLLQSTYDLARPDDLHHEVFQTMVSALLVQPEVRRMVMIGVGGGQLSNYLYRHLPELELDVVDICPEVIRMARAHFGVPDDPRYRLHLGDGRVFIESLEPGSVDLLVHDAYRGHSVPKHLRTEEFFRACAERLAPGGVLVANMHRRTRRYPIDRATMAAVFRHRYRFSSTDDVETSVVSTMAEAALTTEALVANAERLQPRFEFDLRGQAQRCRIDEGGWDPEVVLHDDFDRGQLEGAAERHNRSCTPRCEDD